MRTYQQSRWFIYFMISQIIMEISKIYTISACQSKGIRSNLNMVWPFFQILVSPFFILLIIIPTKQIAYIAASHEGSELKTSKLN